MTNNRKHVRISYEKKVELIAEGQTLVGKSIDISNSGIQVIVNVPVSHLFVHRIAFMLPLASETVHIPCKIVRSNKSESEEFEHVLGIEFSYQTETQMILIDNFIRNMKNIKMKNECEPSDMRVIPRIACNLTGISNNKKNVSIVSIDNISTEGCLISFEGSLIAHDSIAIDVTLPEDPRGITANGTITYVIHNYSGSINRAGVYFSTISDIDSIRIQNFMLKSATSTAMKAIQERRNENIAGNEYLIQEPERIITLFKLLKKEKKSINVLFEKSIMMFVVKMRNVASREKMFTTLAQKEIGDLNLKKHHPVYCFFYLHGSSYYFTSEIREAGNPRLAFNLPTVLHQSDKRSYERKFISDGIDVSLELDDSSLGKLNGKLMNISRRGFLCNVKLKPSEKDFIRLGQSASYIFNREMGLDTFGEIRHLKENTMDDGETLLQIGIEAGIRRKKIEFKRFGQNQWNKRKASPKRSPAGGVNRIKTEVVRYKNKAGKDIVALLNHTDIQEKVPVVILPPAFGKKKEALSPLVATLIENFLLFGKDIVTIRYDGINRPGESYQDDMCPKRGYEMLHYRISQGLDDLEATMEYAYNNTLFKPLAVIVVAFSMSALDARKLAVKDKRVSYLINVMGVTCARSSFSTITGGIDIIDNARIGIQSGLSGVMGHILNLDTIAKDLIENKYAYLADARHDMSQVTIPVSWIYGKYDMWVIEREIKDLMSVRSNGRREAIEIPTGHNLRSSEDAILTFKMVTQLIYRHLHNKTIRPFDPDRTGMVNLITYERERLFHPAEVNKREYWKEYLVGEDRNSIGYDFYKNIGEFKDFLSFQGSLMDLKNGEIMADMGCGTGIFIERMLEDMASRGNDVSRASLVLVDLVSEALARTREKVERLKLAYGSLLPEKVTYQQLDLEPNRLIPVKRFMEDKSLGYEYLRNRIEGMKNATIDNLIRCNSFMISDILRGAQITDEALIFLNNNFSEEDSLAIADFSRAARLLTGSLTPQDLATASVKSGGRTMPDGCREFKLHELIFKKLNFGDKGLCLNLNFTDNSFHKISASLLVSYLFNPDEIILEFYRIIKPDGRLLVSSMRPDSDISVIFTNYINKIQQFDLDETDVRSKEINLAAARAMLNEAGSLLQLEEDGYFSFYSGDELTLMMEKAGFKSIKIQLSMGDPPQAVIVTGIKPGGTIV